MGKVIGILGGMGPEATADLFLRIIKATPAEADQDHFRTIIDSNPAIPDRTNAIIGNGEDPVPEMLKVIKNLEKTDVDFIIIPCNTAHYFIDSLEENTHIPILNMIRLSAIRASSNENDIKKAALLATDGTLKSKIYHREFSKMDIRIIIPDEGNQKDVMKAIYEYIKAGKLEKGRETLQRIAKELDKRGADMVICGCTEVSLVLKEGDIDIPVLDPLQILAEKAVSLASGKDNFQDEGIG
jgi:aspartate racemase